MFEELIGNTILLEAYHKLTKAEKRILELSYINTLKDVEIAKLLNVSQQAVSKTRNKGLAKMKKYISVRKERDHG